MSTPITKALALPVAAFVAFAEYAYFYQRIVFHQEPMTITFFGLIQFLLFFGAPFILAAAVVDEWNIKKSFALSLVSWACVYFMMIVFRNGEFMALYPDGLQCMAVPISMYPGIGLSCLIGHGIGTLIHDYNEAS